jgi:hypothetical protein
LALIHVSVELGGEGWRADLAGWAGQAAIRSNEMLFNSVRSVACSIVMASTRP